LAHGYDRLPAGRGGASLTTFDAERIQGELDDRPAGEDVPEVIRYFGRRKKIFYVHFRNVVGKVPKYTEVFPYEGDGDMVANLKALKEVGYEGYVVPDHHFGLAGDSDWHRCSRAWQVGYIKGLMQVLGI
jgi:mannonate dehydratase